MNHFLSKSWREKQDITIRNVLNFAHEVRVFMRDSQVIVGSMIVHEGAATGDFQIRPWGVRSPMTVRFDDVSHATPVRRMVWERQRRISVAQVAGVFAKRCA